MKISGMLALLFTMLSIQIIYAQEEDLKIGGQLYLDERFLLESPNDWAWNENRLTINLEKRVSGNSAFKSEIWLRNIGLPAVNSSADLYNKGIVDPYNLEIREAYLQINGFLSSKLDLSIGRQRIAWGTADKLNPTDNLNPYDFEDILDFGRHRGSDAIKLDYYFNNDFSFQAVYIPFFQPANLPIGLFSNIFAPPFALPPGINLVESNDKILMPRYNLAESSTAGFRMKGFAKGVDFSLSYLWGRDGLPFIKSNRISLSEENPTDIRVDSELYFARMHILGADLATSIFGIGLMAEAAVYIPDQDVVMSTVLAPIDFTQIAPSALPSLLAMFASSGNSLFGDSLLLDQSKPYTRFIVGTDYNFADGSYFNLQYMHGFIHERGRENLNDYFFLRYEKSFFRDKLKIAPLSGGFIVSDWSNIAEAYSIIFMPEIAYKATINSEISISTILFEGKGDNLFAGLQNYDMLMLKMKYMF